MIVAVVIGGRARRAMVDDRIGNAVTAGGGGVCTAGLATGFIAVVGGVAAAVGLRGICGLRHLIGAARTGVAGVGAPWWTASARASMRRWGVVRWSGRSTRSPVGVM